MKIEMTKQSMTRWCQDSEVELLESAGWKVLQKETRVQEQAVLKPPAKSKGADKQSLDNAIEQGD